MKTEIRKWRTPILATIFASAFLPFFLYFQNSNEATVKEIGLPLFVFTALGLILLLISSIIVHSPSKGAIIATAFILIIENFAALETILKNIFSGLRYWHTVPIIFAAGIHIAYFLHCYMKDEIAVDMTKIFAFVFGGLLLFNAVVNLPSILNRIQAQHKIDEDQKQSQELRIEHSGSGPNVYLFVFDEYANFPQMEEYYNYDNALLKDFFDKNNFSISYSSQNESIVSATVQTNLVNLDYVVDGTFTASEREAIRKKGALFDLMQQQGYAVQIFETGDFYGGHLPEGAGTQKSATINGENLSQILLQRSLFYPFVKFDTAHVIDDILEIVNYLSTPKNLPIGSTFTLTYLNFPHQPFLVDENGNPISSEHMIDWEDDQYYLGQYKYATKLMISMIDNIVKNDPQAVIIVQSDHGARARGSELFGKKFPTRVMINPLNAVYYQGDNAIDIEGLSSVNTLRVVLGKLFAIHYDILDVPDSTDYDFKSNDR